MQSHMRPAMSLAMILDGRRRRFLAPPDVPTDGLAPLLFLEHWLQTAIAVWGDVHARLSLAVFFKNALHIHPL